MWHNVTQDLLDAELRRLEQLREADRLAVTTALSATEAALRQAEATRASKDAAQNEWRATVSDIINADKEGLAVLTATLLTKDEYETKHEALKVGTEESLKRQGERIGNLERDNAVLEGIAAKAAAEQKAFISKAALGVAAVSVTAEIILHYIH